MPILEAMGIKFAKPAAYAEPRKAEPKPVRKQAEPKTDRVQFSAPEVMLREKDEAAGFAAELKRKLLKSPADAKNVHTADYRLMDAIR